jgi:hypothetical protein
VAGGANWFLRVVDEHTFYPSRLAQHALARFALVSCVVAVTLRSRALTAVGFLQHRLSYVSSETRVSCWRRRSDCSDAQINRGHIANEAAHGKTHKDTDNFLVTVGYEPG